MSSSLYLNNPSELKIYIYLHGGPFFILENLNDDPFTHYFNKMLKNIFIINYPVVKRQGGVIDFQYVYQEIERLRIEKTNYELYLIGESYGGYLTSLFSKYNLVEKIICISGFVSIKYQALFSSERVWLTSYLSPEASDFYDIHKKNLVRTAITFFNGTKDMQIPYQQLLPLASNDKIKIVLLDGFKHREANQKMDNLLKKVLDLLD